MYLFIYIYRLGLTEE